MDELRDCPACGDWSDYCQGHGIIGDPAGWQVLTQHDMDTHDDCHHMGCQHAWDEAYKQEQADLHNDDIASGILD